MFRKTVYIQMRHPDGNTAIWTQWHIQGGVTAYTFIDGYNKLGYKEIFGIGSIKFKSE